MTLKTVPVTGTLYNADGSVVAGANVSAQLTVVDADGGVTVPSLVSTTSDTGGAFTLHLWPNARGVNASQYRVRAQMPGALPGDLLANLLIGVPDGDPAIAVPIQTILDLKTPAVSDAQVAVNAARGYATASAASAVQTAADRTQTGLDRAQTGSDRTQTGADVASANASQSAASTSATQAQSFFNRIYLGAF